MNSLQLIIQGALQAHRSGNLAAALQGYRMALSVLPNETGLINQCAVAELQSQRPAEALQLFERSLQIEPRQADVLCNMAYALNLMGEHSRAVALCDRSLAIAQHNPEAQTNKGNAYRAMGEPAKALSCFEAALAAQPERAEYLYNRANALLDLNRVAHAVADYTLAAERAPEVRQIRLNLAAALIRAKLAAQAIPHLEEARRMDPSDPLVWMNLGAAYDTARVSSKAVECFRKSLQIQPGNAAVHANLAQVLDGTGQHVEAIHHYSEALRLDPDLQECLGGRLMARRHICDLTDHEMDLAQLRAALAQGRNAGSPFHAIVLLDDPGSVNAAIQNYVRERIASPQFDTLAPRPASPVSKIRVGYFSADFGEHPVTYLLSPVLRAHDRQAVEVHAFLTQRQPPSAALERVMQHVDEFHDVVGMTLTDIQRLAHSIGIDIAVDLGGHTLNNRPELFASRIAPVQASYLGFPGPSGIPAMDYLLADDALVPPELRHHYPEHIAYLHSYQANEPASPPAMTADRKQRQDHGLPQESFVFCCFSNSYKLSPATLGMWAQILRAAPSSVLWLYTDNEISRVNLRSYFGAQGVDPERLFFAARVSREAYLARMTLADLYLDTTPYSAGTTASDSLRTGLPILTLSGQTFSARMCTSVLRSAGVGELAVGSTQAYVDMAVMLAGAPDVLAGIRRRLTDGMAGLRLFDPAGTARQLESLYQQMHRLRCAGMPLTDLRAD